MTLSGVRSISVVKHILEGSLNLKECTTTTFARLAGKNQIFLQKWCQTLETLEERIMQKLVVATFAILAFAVMAFGVWSLVELQPQPRPLILDPATGRLFSPEVRPESYPVQLDSSDETLLRAARDLDPELAAWLLSTEQVRKWVNLVNLAADGHIPKKNRPLEYPLAPFKVVEREGKQWMDAANFQRANILIDNVVLIPPKKLAGYLYAWEPLLQQAQSELGIDKPFREQLLRAIDRVLSVRPRKEEIELLQGERTYLYADPALEKASGVERLMWRFGADNTLKIQAYLSELKVLL